MKGYETPWANSFPRRNGQTSARSRNKNIYLTSPISLRRPNKSKAIPRKGASKNNLSLIKFWHLQRRPLPRKQWNTVCEKSAGRFTNVTRRNFNNNNTKHHFHLYKFAIVPRRNDESPSIKCWNSSASAGGDTRTLILVILCQNDRACWTVLKLKTALLDLI